MQTTASGAFGVDAETGRLLWSYPIDKTTAVIPTPIVRDDLVYIVAGYKRGGALLRQNLRAATQSAPCSSRLMQAVHGSICPLTSAGWQVCG